MYNRERELGREGTPDFATQQIPAEGTHTHTISIDIINIHTTTTGRYSMRFWNGMPTETKSCLFTFVQIRLCVRIDVDAVYICDAVRLCSTKREMGSFKIWKSIYVRAPKVCFSK